MSDTTFASEYAYDVAHHKYMAPHGETRWDQLAQRVASHPMAALSAVRGGCYLPETDAIYRLIRDRKFIPGGRYLYGCGNDFHQVQNCLLLRAEDTREGWADIGWKFEMSLLTGAGIGAYWGEIRPNGHKVGRTGGTASGPVPKMVAENEKGRAAVQGGDRRSAIWGGLPWYHDDVFRFMEVKNWPDYLKAAKADDPSAPAPLDMTNISVCLDDAFFAFFEGRDAEGQHFLRQQAPDWMRDADRTLKPEYESKDWAAWARRVYWTAVDSMAQTGEPGFSVDVGARWNEKLRNAPVAADTHVLTREGYRQVGQLVGKATTLWTGQRWAGDVMFSEQRQAPYLLEVKLTGGRTIKCDPSHPFIIGGERVPAEELSTGDAIDVSLPNPTAPVALDTQAYTLGWLYGDGSFRGSRAELTLCSDESKRCREFLADPQAETPNDRRGYHRLYYKSEGFRGLSKSRLERAPLDTVEKQASFVAGLMDADGNFEPTQQRIRLAAKHPSLLDDVRRLLEELGIVSHVSKAGTSTFGRAQGYQLVVAAEYHDRFVALIPCRRVPLTARRTRPYRASKIKVVSVRRLPSEPVYCADVKVPEHAFVAEGVLISNCTEIVSEDDSDICNLGGLNLARFDDPVDFEQAVRLGVLFLTAGTVYSDLPYPKVAEVRDKNRRLGLDVLGVHEFLLRRGLRYGTDDAFEAFEPYMRAYSHALEYAHVWQSEAGLSLSVAATSGAPTGTRGIVAETTTGWEPVFASAYRRDVITSKAHTSDERKSHYVVDPTVARLVKEGWLLPTDDVEDSYSLAQDYERRFAMQAYAQSYTDQAISMTVNLPHVMTDATERRQFGETLYRYLPKLRGITVYPDGAISGQPITKVPIAEALGLDAAIWESEEKCASGVCGI